MEKQPLVSVIIPTYNRDTYLLQAIESVVNQTYTHIEILVVDDGSSVPYAKDFCDRFEKCNYYYKENGGLSSARNFGVSKAKGDYIAFLDDDDFWREDKLEKQVAQLVKNKEIDLVHSAAMVVDESGKPTGKIIGASNNKAQSRSGNVFWNALGTWVVKSPTPLIRKKVFSTHLCFDETIKVGEDIDFYQRLFYQRKIEYINDTLAYYREFSDATRLSRQRKKYVGIEEKMIHNFKKMGVANPWVLHRISIHLLRQAIRNWNLVYQDNPKKISSWDVYIRPQYCLSHYFKV